MRMPQVMENLKGRGIELHAGSLPTRIVKTGEGAYSVTYRTAEGAEATLQCGLVMMATGERLAAAACTLT